jgi:cysteine desulfurase
MKDGKPRPIYLDYMATTPVDPRVIEVMLKHLGPMTDFGNPASLQHVYGQAASLAVAHAREQIAQVVHCDPEELVFTSGATEANNLAILGAARFYQRKGRHVVTMTTEHKSVLDSVHQLEKEGFDVTYLNPGADGILNLSDLHHALREDTILVSVMQVNNEIGVIQDIEAVAELLRGRGIVFHVDASQSAGRLAIDLRKTSVDLMSFSAHKQYGPKGVGALFVRRKPRIRLQAQSFGGGHEGGLRSGTLATHQIAGFGEAFFLAEATRVDEQARLLTLRRTLWDGLKSLPGIGLNGSEHTRVAGNLNLSFHGIDGEALLPALHELAVSSSSACLSASVQPSYVLQALGLSLPLARSSIRLSIGRFTTADDIQQTIRILREVILTLKGEV